MAGQVGFFDLDGEYRAPVGSKRCTEPAAPAVRLPELKQARQRSNREPGSLHPTTRW